jgi:SAM-dependent methyltransferase
MHKSKKNEIFQLKNIYESTIQFEKFINENKGFENIKTVLDAGCGIGSNSYFFSKKNPSINFVGGDYRKKNIEEAKKILSSRKNNKIKFINYNILKPSKNLVHVFDGIICIHTFCTFKNSKNVITSLCKLKPKWIAINSLFYEGPIETLIHIRDAKIDYKDSDPDGDFNIFSIPKVKKQFLKNGYRIKFVPFFPQKKLNMPKDKSRGSYTVKTSFNKNTIFSGPVHLPWYFIFAKKI